METKEQLKPYYIFKMCEYLRTGKQYSAEEISNKLNISIYAVNKFAAYINKYIFPMQSFGEFGNKVWVPLSTSSSFTERWRLDGSSWYHRCDIAGSVFLSEEQMGITIDDDASWTGCPWCESLPESLELLIRKDS